MANTFDDFLKLTPSQKEVSLAIAKENDELSTFLEVLENQGFRQIVDIQDLFKYVFHPSAKVFFVVKGLIPKDIYDFILQYPTGQVEVYDYFNLKSKLATPSYDNTSVILLVIKEDLKRNNESGFQILDQVGLTYQS
jgi:hypothetical protein